MIEIVVMIGVVCWFLRAAKSRDKSRPLWGFIGAISYYGPALVFGNLIYPEIVRESLTYDNQTSYIIGGVLSSLAIGIGCCLLARNILLSKKR